MLISLGVLRLKIERYTLIYEYLWRELVRLENDLLELVYFHTFIFSLVIIIVFLLMLYFIIDFVNMPAG